jgi:hypothetical protein
MFPAVMTDERLLAKEGERTQPASVTQLSLEKKSIRESLVKGKAKYKWPPH